MATVYLGLGTNLGDKPRNLHKAVHLLTEQVGELIALSSFYETVPSGFESDNQFLNAAVALEVTLNPLELLAVTQKIEKEMGRKTKSNGTYSDRIIDIDLLIYEGIEMKTAELTLPHPLMEERDFVMRPLTEILK